MKTFFETIAVAFSMFSRVPVKNVEWTDANRKYSLLAFPLVGVVLGLCWFGVAWVCDRFSVPDLLTGAFLTGLPLLVVGGFHLDGYADTADALASHGDREKKLEIMKDPHVGSFAVLQVAVCLILWFAASASIAATDAAVWALTAVVFVLSRTLSGLAVTTFPMAKDTGLAKSFAEDADKRKVRNGLIVLLVLLVLIVLSMDLWLATLPAALLLCLAAAAVFLRYRHIAKKQFGGITGDLCGWFLCKAEVWMLAAVAAVCTL